MLVRNTAMMEDVRMLNQCTLSMLDEPMLR